jgi:hypothetical protein
MSEASPSAPRNRTGGAGGRVVLVVVAGGRVVLVVVPAGPGFDVVELPRKPTTPGAAVGRVLSPDDAVLVPQPAASVPASTNNTVARATFLRLRAVKLFIGSSPDWPARAFSALSRRL